MGADARHPSPPQVTYKLTPSWYATTAAAIHTLGAKLTIGVNLGANQPALAAAEARRDVQAFKGSLQAFEIGNEPNVYNKIAAYRTASGTPVLTRPPSFDYPQYADQFRAIARRLPALPLAGPALAAGPKPVHGSWTEMMTSFMERQSPAALPDDPPLPAAQLLRRADLAPVPDRPEPAVELLDRCAWRPASPATCSSRTMPAASCGSTSSTRSPATASAASATRSPPRCGRSTRCSSSPGLGVDGVNLHTLPHSAYQLFSFSHAGGRWSASVAPVYYGLYLFSQAAPPGSRLLKIDGARHAPGLSVWATRAPDGQVRAVVDNENPSRRVDLGLRAPRGTAGPATLLRLRAPGVHARGHVTIGGAGFGARTDSGILPPPAPLALDERNGLYSLVGAAPAARRW